MTVLLRLGSDDKAPKCDTRCFSARNERCACRVCGGLLHGVGLDGALRLREQLVRYLQNEGAEQEMEAVEGKDGAALIVLRRPVKSRVRNRLRMPHRVKTQLDAGQKAMFNLEPEPVRAMSRKARRRLT